MAGIVQSIDVDVRLDGGQLEFPETVAVTDCEVTRIFGGGGSQAKVDVIFEEALTDDQITGLRRSVRSATQNPRFDDVQNFVDVSEVEDPKESLTFDDLEGAIANGDIETQPANDGEQRANGAFDGRIVSETVGAVGLEADANLLKNFTDRVDSNEDAISEIANYESASGSEQAVWEREESLTAQANVRGIVTKAQVRTVKEKADELLAQEDEKYQEEQERREQQRADQVNELDQRGGAPRDDETTETDGLIDPGKLFAGNPIVMEIDAVVNQIKANSINQEQHRLFTGTVTKVTETNDRKVRFECIDARYQLNNFVVRTDVEKGVPRHKVVDEILGGGALYGGDEGINADALGSDSGVAGISAGADAVTGTELPEDPAKNITMAELRDGLPADKVNATDELEDRFNTYSAKVISNKLGYAFVNKYIDDVLRSTTTDPSEISLLDFTKFSEGRITNIANESETDFFEQKAGKQEVDVEEIKRLQNLVDDLIKPVGESGKKVDSTPLGIRPQGFQSDVEEAENRQQNAQEAEEEAVATYEIEKRGDDVIPKAQSWGVNFHKTAYNVIQELGYRSNAQLYIDEYNTIYWADEPERDVWSPNGDGDARELPPIVSWESGDEQTEKDVIVESKYNETALGAFHPLTTKRVPDDVEEPSGGFRDMRVTSANELQNAKITEVMDREVKRDSGVIRVTGNPNITAQDQVKLDEDAVDGFAAISQGEYFAKEVKHIINSDEGYLTQIELGSNIDELYEEFAYDQSGLNFEDTQEEAEEEAEEASEDQANDAGVPGTDNPVYAFLDNTLGDGDGEIEGLGPDGDGDLNPFD